MIDLQRRRFRKWSGVFLLGICLAAAEPATSYAQDATTSSPAPTTALPEGATGAEVYRLACAACHGADGRGSPESVVGFRLPLANGHGFPDFTDCPTNTVEPLADWMAVAHSGGPIRALDRRMPAFGDALTSEQLESALRHIWSFCTDPAWPRGDLNLPRPFFTEKAFPENETVWTIAVDRSDGTAITNDFLYERRLGSRAQYEVTVPFSLQESAAGSWQRGIGDVELALKRTLYASLERGSIFSAGGAITLPTGKEQNGLGKGHAVIEPFAMWGQMFGNGFLQAHGGLEVPTDQSQGANEGFLRTAVGYTLAEDRGLGRAWTPMIETLVAKPDGGGAEWDVVPQMQVSLSRLQHVLIDVGVRVPVTQRDERSAQFLAYLLWDWFDGGLFQFWK